MRKSLGNKIKNRTEFKETFPFVYLWLVKNNPDLLDKVFPSTKRSQKASEKRV